MECVGFIQNNGWYFLALIIVLAYVVNKFWPTFLKWSEQRAKDSYEAEIKKSNEAILNNKYKYIF